MADYNDLEEQKQNYNSAAAQSENKGTPMKINDSIQNQNRIKTEELKIGSLR